MKASYAWDYGREEKDSKPEICLDIDSFFDGFSSLWDCIRHPFSLDQWFHLIFIVYLLAALLGVVPWVVNTSPVTFVFPTLTCVISPRFPSQYLQVERAL